MRALFSIASLLTGLLGLIWLIAPAPAFRLWGVEVEAISIYMARRYAVLFFGYTVILWMNRGASRLRRTARFF